MNTRMKLPKDRLNAIPPDLLETYLLTHGWMRDPTVSSDKVAGFRYPSEPDAEALVPLRRNFGDYALRVADVVEMIAAVEQRWTWEVFLDFENSLKTQLSAADSKNGEVNGANKPSDQGASIHSSD